MGGLSFAPAMVPLRLFLVLAPLPPPFADKRRLEGGRLPCQDREIGIPHCPVA